MTESPRTLFVALDEVLGSQAASEVLADVILKTIIRRIPITYDDAITLREFTYNMINIVNPSYGVILAALTYIDRYFNSKTRFNEKDTLIHYRLILGAFLCAYKYVNERSVKNTAWIRASSETFNLTEINIIERKFLACLQYDLVVEDMSTQESWLVTVRDVLELGTPLMKKNASLAADTPRSVSTTGTPSLKTSASPRTSVISTTSIALFQKVESARRKSWKGFLKLFSKGAKDSDKTEKDGEKEKGGQKKL